MKRNIVKIRRWVILRRQEGWPVTKICAHGRISRATCYRILGRYDGSRESLEPKSHKPHTIHRTSQKVENKVIELRKQLNWGPNKIEAYLKRQGIKLGHNTIYRIICRAGLNNPIDKPRKTWGKKRFARTRPNALWQADWKLCENDYWMITYLDDYSRFIPGSKKFWNPTTENALSVLKKATRKYSIPEQILTDRGIQFYPSRKTENAKSRFTKALEELGIQHIVASIRRPTTIGKVEAFHKAYVCEAHMFNTHKKFIQYWNYKRLHQGIKYLIPSELYFKR